MKKKHILTLIVIALGVMAAIAFTVFGSKADSADASSKNANQGAALTVEIVKVEQHDWTQGVRASGALAAIEEVVISPETGGLRIAALLAHVGDRVVKGQVLARLSDEAARVHLAKQQALVQQAEASWQQALANLKRSQALDVKGAIAPMKLDEYIATEANARAALASAHADLDSAQLTLSQTRILAPDAGIIASRSGVAGNVVSVGTELFRLIRQGQIEWRAELDVRQLAQVNIGQKAQVTLPDGQTIFGQVRRVSPSLSTTTGRAIVYVWLSTGPAVRAGVFANGSIVLPVKAAWTLPESAVIQRDGRNYVYVVNAESKVSARPVTTDRRQGGRVEITSGLDTSARVVAKGGGFLSEGARVAIVGVATAVEVAK